MALITGSLGSGKTTLLQTILEKTDQRLAILMNEFGKIAIDSEVLQGENVQMVELPGACVCCELKGEFEAAVTEIIEKLGPEFIVVEAMGVAEADALVYEVEDKPAPGSPGQCYLHRPECLYPICLLSKGCLSPTFL
jgi:G3E family GTPase